jgi:hypothetical protein
MGQCAICGSESLENEERVCAACMRTFGERAQQQRRASGDRNEHGTRVATAINCTACGKRDRIPWAPRSTDRILCRACAGEILNVFAAGIERPPRPGEDLYEKLGLEKPSKDRIKGTKTAGKKPGSIVYKRRKSSE